ncbi:MAG TPA: BON domain-containing protein [Agitococcus sp.]|nr:BON domain-containing protein [Agitococcus sp.]HMX98349.1 BON domain-containing protein [Agitococcus sp.]HMY81360.1 BON domain-containing protein [Agitococcus sp.]HNB19565.1 BON domain-containing protein [Agitococcus sp.]HNC85908.1 BON domain-containing protein [Agitococcus sp.]
MKKSLIFLMISSLWLTGCAQMIAATSGSEPVGKQEGERTLSQRIEDSSIENTANINLYKIDPEFKNANVVFMSFHSNVLITGQVTSIKHKQQVEDMVRSIREVNLVHNELVVTPQISSYLNRAKDGVLKLQIASKLTFMKEFPSSQCKVLVENGTVYLMAKLTRSQTEQAINTIKETPDITRIVKLVDYLD